MKQDYVINCMFGDSTIIFKFLFSDQTFSIDFRLTLTHANGQLILMLCILISVQLWTWNLSTRNTLLKLIPYRVVIAELLRKGWAKTSNYGGTWSELQNRITKLYGAALQSTSPELVQLVQVITKFSVSCWHSSLIEVLSYELLGLFNLFPVFPLLV